MHWPSDLLPAQRPWAPLVAPSDDTHVSPAGGTCLAALLQSPGPRCAVTLPSLPVPPLLPSEIPSCSQLFLSHSAWLPAGNTGLFSDSSLWPQVASSDSSLTVAGVATEQVPGGAAEGGDGA